MPGPVGVILGMSDLGTGLLVGCPPYTPVTPTLPAPLAVEPSFPLQLLSRTSGARRMTELLCTLAASRLVFPECSVSIPGKQQKQEYVWTAGRLPRS